MSLVAGDVELLATCEDDVDRTAAPLRTSPKLFLLSSRTARKSSVVSHCMSMWTLMVM